MRIVDIETLVVGAPWRELTFVELVTDDGRRGLGEVRMVNKTDTLVACITEVGRKHVIGADPFDVEQLAWKVQWEEYGRVGEVAQSALAALDMACWDLMGQSLGVPIWKLLGGQFRDSVPAYANGWYAAERSPEALALLAKSVVDRGYRGLKLDPFGAASGEIDAAGLRDAVELVSAVREAVGPDTQLMIEMHGRFVPASALRAIEALSVFDPEWFEEPVPPYSATSLAQIRAATTQPLATGERAHTLNDLTAIVNDGLADYVQADLTHFGGFTGMRKLAGWAGMHDRLLAPHNVCGPVGTMANIHFAVATPNVKVLEHFNDFADPWVLDLVDDPPSVTADGSFALPTKPGLGLTLDRDLCDKHPRSAAYFDLFTEGWERRDDSGDRAPS